MLKLSGLLYTCQNESFWLPHTFGARFMESYIVLVRLLLYSKLGIAAALPLPATTVPIPTDFVRSIVSAAAVRATNNQYVSESVSLELQRRMMALLHVKYSESPSYGNRFRLSPLYRSHSDVSPSRSHDVRTTWHKPIAYNL